MKEMDNKISQKEIKEILLDLLKTIKQICDENDLRYFLAGGTLLGAIRHKGFIPWDDDIDITMPREDLMKLVEIFINRPADHFKLLSFYTDKTYFNLHAKLVDTRTQKIYSGVQQLEDAGVNADIFPLDGLPKEEKEIKRFVRRLNFLQTMRWGAVKEVDQSNGKWLIAFPKRILRGLYKLIGYQYPINEIEKLVRRYEFDASDFVGEFVSVLGIRAKVSKKAFEEHVKVQFEDDFFNAPIGYHEYLTVLYGDYMQLPPVEKRVNHHINEIFWKLENKQ